MVEDSRGFAGQWNPCVKIDFIDFGVASGGRNRSGACVTTRRKKNGGVKFRLGFIEVYQWRRLWPLDPPTQLPTQNSYR